MIELIAVFFSLICVYLATRQNSWSWAFGTVGVIAYFIVFLQISLWGQVGLQVIFFAQNLYGWWNWKYGHTDDKLKVSTLNNKQRLLYLIIIGIGTFILTMILTHFTTDAMPFFDSLISVSAIICLISMEMKVLLMPKCSGWKMIY